MLCALHRIWFFIRHGRCVEYTTSRAMLLIGSDVELRVSPGARIRLGGRLVVGYPLPGARHARPNRGKTVIELRSGALFETEGDVFLAPGVDILLASDAHLRFGGDNVVAHDSKIYAFKRVEIGRASCVSWDSTLMDSDAHIGRLSDGSPVRPIRRPLVIGDGVGLQMGVMIPRGVTIGNDAIVGAGVILRQDVPAAAMIYDAKPLRVRGGLSSGMRLAPS